MAGGARTGHPRRWGGAGLTEREEEGEINREKGPGRLQQRSQMLSPAAAGVRVGSRIWQARARILRKGLLSLAQRETSRQPEYNFIPFKSEFSAACVVGNGPVPPAKVAAGSELWLVATVCGLKP